MDPLKVLVGGVVTVALAVVGASIAYQIGKSPNAVPLWADANATARNVTGTLFK